MYGPVLRTDQSFTVSAWANPEDLGDGAHSIVSQDGPTRTPFALSYRPRVVNGVQGDYWTFSMLPPSGDGADSVQSKAPLSYDDASRWTHLVAVYDATRKEVRLYVNGELQNRTHNWMPVWQASGPLTIGAALFNGVRTDRWYGGIDDVHVYQAR